MLTTNNRRALVICRRTCPVRAECQDDADPQADAGLIRGGRPLWPAPTANVFKPQEKPPTKRNTCGTRHGADTHRKFGEESCDPCRRARARADVEHRQRYRAGDPRFRHCSHCDGWYPLNVLGQVHAHKPWFVDADSGLEHCPGSRRAPREIGEVA